MLRGSETLPVKREQEIQLSLTNRLSKRNDVADLTSVIKIRLKKIDSSHPAFQGGTVGTGGGPNSF